MDGNLRTDGRGVPARQQLAGRPDGSAAERGFAKRHGVSGGGYSGHMSRSEAGPRAGAGRPMDRGRALVHAAHTRQTVPRQPADAWHGAPRTGRARHSSSIVATGGNMAGSGAPAAAAGQSLPSTPAGDMNRLVVFTADKAGMVGVDKKKVNQVVFDMSKNSSHFKNAKRLDMASDKRVAEMKRIVESTKHVKSPALEKRIEARINELETTRDLSRIWVVIDMDMFFAAVEMRENPSLRGKPVAVGGMAMISTANYEARTYGVRSAMPGFIAVKLCPHLVFVGHSRELYKKIAAETREIYQEYDPSLTAMSLDEAYLDVTEYWRRNCERYLAMAKHAPRPERCTTFGEPPRPQVPPTRGPGAPVAAALAPHGDAGAGGGAASPAAAFGPPASSCSAAAGGASTLTPRCNTGSGMRDVTAHASEAGSSSERCPSPTGKDRTLHQDSDDDIDAVDDFRASGFSFSQEVEAGLGEGAAAESDASSDDEAAECGLGGASERRSKHLAGGALPVNSGPGSAFFREPVFEAGLHLMVQEIRDRVYDKTRLTCSAGIAPNPMLAKICSDKHKPDGQFLLPFARDSIVEFARGLPVRKVPGVGKVTEKLLSAIGCTTCGDAFTQRVMLARVFSQRTSDWLLRVSLGISNALRLPFTAAPKRKSMSTERTFREIHDPGDQVRKCRELCEKLAGELQEKGLKGRTITLKIKHTDFRVFQRSQSRKRYVNSADDLFQTAVALLRTFQPCRLRLMGVRVNNFQNTNTSVSERDASQAALDAFLVKAPQDAAPAHNTHPRAPASVASCASGVGPPPDRRASQAALDVFLVKPPQDSVPAPAQPRQSAAGGSEPSLGPASGVGRTASLRKARHARVGASHASPRAARQAEGSVGRAGRANIVDVQVAPIAGGFVASDPLVQCPVCGRQVCARNEALNKHIDACLRGEQPVTGPAWTQEHTKRLVASVGPSVGPGSASASKRRKLKKGGAAVAGSASKPGGKALAARSAKLPRGQRTLSFSRRK